MTDLIEGMEGKTIIGGHSEDLLMQYNFTSVKQQLLRGITHNLQLVQTFLP